MASPGRLSAKAAQRLFGEAVALHRAGRHAEAERPLNRLRAAFPDHPDVCHLLGVVRLALDRAHDALRPLQDAAALAERARPDILPGVLNALGSALRQAGRTDEALVPLGRAAALAPDSADVRFNLGNVQCDLSRLPEAVDSYRAAARLAPDDTDILFALGATLARVGDEDGAMAAYEAVLALDPAHVRALSGLGGLRVGRGDLAGARAALEKAVALDPPLAEAHANLGLLRVLIGEADAAVAAGRSAIAINPGLADAHSNLIQQMHYSARFTAAAILDEAREWNARHAVPCAGRIRPHANSRDPERRLKVGYVGGDFRFHPVGWFTLSLFVHHDPKTVETFVYMTHAKTDSMSERLRGHIHHWRDVSAIDAAALADAVRGDGIDILVDMAGHTAKNRLLALAERPAPVQAVGGGVMCTTGMDAVDYFLADAVEIPAGFERFYSESVVRLPHGNVCYAPPDYAPGVAPLPARAEGRVAFGCFNGIAKVSPEAVALWARVLKAVPGSRFLFKTFGLANPECRERFARLFADHGIGAERLILEGPAPHVELLEAYGRVDAALDPLPYSGGLTTLESLWMGVPVVTLPGETFASRHSASHLSNAGFPELIARDADDYVAIAVRLAADLDALAALRADLRARVAASPVCDGATYARGLEEAYRTMWRAWCRGETPRGFTVPPSPGR